MNLPNQYLLSDLLKHHVKCDKGLDHGSGLSPWMHPPVHRLLGWSCKPSSFRTTREVWKLDQLRGIGSDSVYVKGNASITDQITLDRLPTLLYSDILNIKGEKLGLLVDFVFEPITGKIIQYMISRSDPRIPGTSRWLLLIERIVDQQPGMVSIDISSLDDLPLVRASFRQDLLRRSKNWREQIQEFSDQATGRLEGWLDEAPWEDRNYRSPNLNYDDDSLDNWSNLPEKPYPRDPLDSKNDIRDSRYPFENSNDNDDPWI